LYIIIVKTILKEKKMFKMSKWKDQKGSLVEVPPPKIPQESFPSIPVPQPEVYTSKDIVIDEEYVALSKKLGTTCGEITKIQRSKEVEEFKKFLHGLKIITYSSEDVERFMDNEVKRLHQRNWDWCPLRESDYTGSSYGSYLYQKPVPITALQKVEKIIENYHSPQNLYFYVSDFNVERPDPFLAVQICGELIVIDHWDEPTFRINT
jgi:hypothetical protein